MKKSMKKMIVVPIATAVLLSASVLTGFSVPSASAAEKNAPNVGAEALSISSSIDYALRPNESVKYGPFYATGSQLRLNIYDQYSSQKTNVDFVLYKDVNGYLTSVGYEEFAGNGDATFYFNVEQGAFYYLKLDNDSTTYDGATDIDTWGTVVVNFL